MPTTKIENVDGELVTAEKKYPVRLELTVSESWEKNSTQPLAREVTNIEPLSLSGIPDGNYELRFLFDGDEQEHPVRISYGFLLARN